ncbi:MAG: glycoside hydrolase family 3 C-terminal domain-containing protein [Bacteroidota bacterium]|nr:glycoside hydrolase family 3 C-terminal domain-containing protein [Bacteroidota bacterium]
MYKNLTACIISLCLVSSVFGQKKDDRIQKIISQMTLKEKVLQMQNDAPAIPRLGIPAYNWWNECLHGVARNGVATVFPQAIGMSATWDPELIKEEADIISTEARAKHNEAMKNGKSGIYQGLTFWSPNINIFRDPRWGRGQETYGEDPYLTGRIGVAFVKGLQGDNPEYYKIISTPKHLAVHSGPEPLRHTIDTWCSETDLYETYLPAFEALIREGKAASVMGAYNRFWNVPCCASDLLLDQILRKKWGFDGYVVTDCGAIWDIFVEHKLVPTQEKASVLGVKAGCDLTCGDEFGSLDTAVVDGYISEKLIDRAITRLFTARAKLGMFDPDSLVPYSKITISENDRDESRQLAKQVALESMVLLKNEGNVLPLSKMFHTLAVIGPYADKKNVLLGNYNGEPSHPVTLLQGIRNRAGSSIKVIYAEGVIPFEDTLRSIRYFKDSTSFSDLEKEALRAARKSDAVIFIGGISPDLEGEALNLKMPGFLGGDRTTLDLPENQQRLLKKLRDTGKPIILVLTGGGAFSVNWADSNLPAILDIWYPGEEGGNALAAILFGDYNPAGRLPVTFYKSVNDLPPFENYAMKGRTYRYYSGKPLYAFGHGLSYSHFNYISVLPSIKEVKPSDTLNLKITLKNTGNFDGDEVIQVYVRHSGDVDPRPIRSLKAFHRVHFIKGEEKIVKIPLVIHDLRVYDPESGDYILRSGEYEIEIGAASDDIRLKTSIYVQ